MDLVINIFLGVIIVALIALLILRKMKTKAKIKTDKVNQKKSIVKEKVEGIPQPSRAKPEKEKSQKSAEEVVMTGQSYNFDFDPGTELLEEDFLNHTQKPQTGHSYLNETVFLGKSIKVFRNDTQQILYNSVISDPITIGRDPNHHITLGEERVSRNHCVIFLQNDRVFIKDSQSTNGTLLNKKTVVGMQELQSNDIIDVGTVLLKVEIK